MSTDFDATRKYKKKDDVTPSLIVFDGNTSDVKVVPFVSSLTFGRADSEKFSDIQVCSPYVSGEHGVFTKIGGHYYYTDKHSSNGTLLNGVMMVPESDGSVTTELNDGDALGVDRISDGKGHPAGVTIIFSTSIESKDDWKKKEIAEGDVVTIGRSNGNSIAIQNDYISRDQLRITNEGGHFFIEPLSDANDIFVNNARIHGKKALNEHSAIRICDTIIYIKHDSLIYNDHIAMESGLQINIIEANVKQKFKNKTLIKDIHIEIAPKDFVLILGGSGAGKSTLVKSILGRYKVKGSVSFSKKDGEKFSMAYVPQQLNIREDELLFDVINDTALLRSSHLKTQKQRNQAVDDTLRTLGLYEKRNSRISMLSGGEKRRAVIANEVITDPDVFFLDEPDSGLDPNSGYELMKQLRSISESGKIVVLISHNYNSYPHPETLFTKVLVLAKSEQEHVGKLAFLGTVPEALAFFEVKQLSNITALINPKYENGFGLADEFVEKFRRLQNE